MDVESARREHSRRADRAKAEAIAAVWSLPTHTDFMIRNRLDRLIQRVEEEAYASGFFNGRASVGDGTYDEEEAE